VGITFLFVTHDQDEALSMSDRVAVFNKGRIEQVGTPVELYEHPATAFVAGFVGSSNLLAGDEAARVVGRAGTFTIRPEKLRLLTGGPAAAAPADGERTVDGTVDDVQYLGAQTRLRVVLDGGTRLVVSRPNVDHVEAAGRGERVRVAFRPEHALELPAELPADAAAAAGPA